MRSASHQLVDGWFYFKLTMIIIIDKVGIDESHHAHLFAFQGLNMISNLAEMTQPAD